MTDGNTLKRITLFAIPCIIGNALQNLYNILDSVIVGKSDDISALAAVGATGSLITLFLNTVTGLMTGFGVTVGKRYGAKDAEGVKKTYSNALLLTFGIAVLISVLGAVFSNEMLKMMNTPGDIIDSASRYLRIIFIGMIFSVLYNFFCEMMRAVGNSKMPLVFLLISSLIHIILLPIFLFVFSMGVVGAALSTVLSQFCAVIFCYIYIRVKIPQFRISADIFKPEKAVMMECLKIGIPMAVTSFVVMFGGIILSFVTNGIGTEYVAAYTCASRVGYIVTTPIFGFATALAVFTAQNVGSGNLARIKEGIKKTFATVTAVNVLLFVAFWFATEPLMNFMLGGEGIAVEAAKTYLLTRCGAMFTLTFAAGFKNVLNSMGRTAFPTISGFIEIGVRYLIPLTLSEILGFYCVPLTDAVSWTVLAVFLTVAYFIEIRKIERNGQRNEE